jgi:hypothetical protein
LQGQGTVASGGTGHGAGKRSVRALLFSLSCSVFSVAPPGSGWLRNASHRDSRVFHASERDMLPGHGRWVGGPLSRDECLFARRRARFPRRSSLARCPYCRGEEREWKDCSGSYDLDGIAAILVAQIKLSPRAFGTKNTPDPRERETVHDIHA